MDALTLSFREVDPEDPAIAPVIARHLKLMYASSPACSVHAMTPKALGGADVTLYAAFEGDMPVAIGALKAISPGHGELKSMHVVTEARGRGLARRMLAHLTDVAKSHGMGRLSLETGAQEAFLPARALYASEGFEDCAPFAAYRPDANSVFMTRAL